MLKIIYTISKLKKDGPNKVLKAMIDGLCSKSEYELTIVSFLDGDDKDIINYYLSRNVNVISLKLKNKLDILLKGKSLLKNICKEVNPDIIHSHGILPDIINIKIKSINTKKFTTIHNNMYEDYIFSFGKLKGMFFIFWHQFYLRKMNNCICCSKYVYDCMKDKLKNVSWIQNTIYTTSINEKKYLKNRKELRTKLDINKDDIVYLFSGVLSERKNVRRLIEMFENNLDKNEYLLILGDGPLKDELKNNCKNSRIIFLGFVDNVFDYYSAADVYVSFSKSEGFSISILEALEYNNYLLVSDIPSHKEIFEVDKKIYIGEFFSSNDFLERKKSLVRNLKNDCNINMLLIEHLNVYNMMEKYLEVYKKY